MDGLDARLISGTDEEPLHPFFSPVGQWVGYRSRSNGQLKKIAISGGAPVTLCDATGPRRPMWNINGTIVYVQAEGIMKVSANGGTPQWMVNSEGGLFFAPQILPDGKSVLFSLNEGGENRIAVQSLQSAERKILTTGINSLYLPTGPLVYGLGNNLFAVPFPDVNGGKWQVSTSGGREPKWSPDGRELFYLDLGGDAMMVVDIETEPSFKAGIPDELFQGPYYDYWGYNWDISPDGRRFLMIKEPNGDPSTEETPHPKINIVLNWFEELEERVPMD